MDEYKNLYKLLPYLKKYILLFLGASIGIIICSFLFAPAPYLIGYAIDKVVLLNKSPGDLYKIVLILAALYVGRYAVSIFSQYLFIRLDKNVVNQIRIDLMDKIIDLPMSFLNKKEKGYILGRITECGNIGNLFSTSFINALLGIIDLISSMIMIFVISYKLAFIVILVIPVYFLTVKYSSKKLSESTKTMLETSAFLNAETYEILNGVEDIKILCGKETQLIKFKDKLKSLIQSSIKQGKNLAFFMGNVILINNMGSVLLLLAAGLMILNGHLTIGVYTSFVGYLSKILANTQAIASLSITLKPICISIQRVFEFLKLEGENTEGSEVLDREIDSIEVSNMEFSYDHGQTNIISQLSFRLEKGDRALIKGSNGSGKSTLIKLLLRLYEPLGGHILYNSKDAARLDKDTLRKKFGVVSQKVFLFRGTVLENILYGYDNKSSEDVIKLIDRFDLHRYLSSFSKGLDTEINKDGGGLSGGQIQFIAFIRAILIKKDILILDEATSNMDVKLQQDIIGIVNKENLANIVLIVSHQDSSAILASKVINMNGTDASNSISA